MGWSEKERDTETERKDSHITQHCNPICIRAGWACGHRCLRCGPVPPPVVLSPGTSRLWLLALMEHEWFQRYFRGNSDYLSFWPQCDLTYKFPVFMALDWGPCPWPGLERPQPMFPSPVSSLVSHQLFYNLVPDMSQHLMSYGFLWISPALLTSSQRIPGECPENAIVLY